MSVVEMKVPVIGESINEVTLSQWLKPDGSFVKIDEPICEFESDKATLEFPAEAEGKLIHVAKEGDDLAIGALVARIDTSVKSSNGKTTPAEPKEEKATEQTKTKEPESKFPEEKGENSIEKPEEISAHPSPAAAKIMREKAVDPSSVSGTGKEGRITKSDAVKATSEKKPTEKITQIKEEEPKENLSKTSYPTELPETHNIPFQREERREKMSRMRRTIARRLVSAKNNTAMLTTFNEVDMSGVMELRKKYQDQFVAKYGIKLGFMSIFAKACAQALLEKPEVNAHIDGDDLIYHDYVDISIAISTPNGLVVPPIHNVESLRFDEIEFKIKELADKARAGKLTLEEMSGGTFTITNGGIFGSLVSTPIINEPQSAILGMHNIVDRPVVVDGQIVIRPMMYVALSYDHRVIDGSTSVTFLVRVKELLEDPARLILGI
ncbi:MAG TPA: 2-oxoglutarate dehydrogenase complex dihydrolipoyllysine-residue succinyltransferase [Saprospiraceae bacterium]|nr:2-oxoglutarate dehydrogenase complex dihydrolipoyllysine-residue succinyltransferase [Saprospiraceae bacterium]